MDQATLISLIHQLLPPGACQKGLAVIGALALVKQAVPRLLSWGVPAAGKAADWVARTGLNSPLRPLILWQAPAIVSFMDDLASALTKLIDTFKGELEADIAAAAAAQTKANGQANADGPKAS